jgi:hypothetical protein
MKIDSGKWGYEEDRQGQEGWTGTGGTKIDSGKWGNEEDR